MLMLNIAAHCELPAGTAYRYHRQVCPLKQVAPGRHTQAKFCTYNLDLIEHAAWYVHTL